MFLPFFLFCLRRVIPVLFMVCVFAAGGCARVSVVSAVKADGSMRRTLTYSGNVPAAKPDGNMMPIPGSSLEDILILPTKAGGWEVTRTRAAGKSDGEMMVTATRLVAAGAIQKNDLGIRNPTVAPAAIGKPAKTAPAPTLVENRVVVRQTAPGTLEYRETLHWTGPADEGFGPELAPEALAAMKNGLPPALASDTVSLRKAALGMQKKMWQMLMGPSDPLLPTVLLHPDYALYRLTQQLRTGIDQTLTEVYGDRLSDADRKTAVDRIVADAAKSAITKTNTEKQAQVPGGETGGSKTPPPTPLLFRLQMPGKVTATNGQLDPVTGEVVWCLYSSSPAGGDIVLTATCKTSE